MMTQNDTSETNPILTWLGKFGAVTGAIGVILYVAGLIACTAHYRILGVNPSYIPAQQYLETGGRCAGLIFQALLPGPQNLFWNLFNPAYSVPEMNWGGAWLICWAIAAVFLVPWIIVRWRIYPNLSADRRASFKTAFNITALIVVIALTATMLSLESELLRIPARLQPFEAADFAPVSAAVPEQNKIAPDYATLRIRAQKTTGFLLKTSKGKPSPHFARLFFPEDETGHDLPRLMTFCKIVWLTALTLAILFLLSRITEGRTARTVRIATLIFLSAQIILLPAAYGVMGREYLYPAVRVECKQDKQIVVHFPVIMLISNDKEIVIYDRINRMSIQHIPKSAVLNIKQFFLTSPFSNCSGDADPQRIIPCELEAIPH